MLTETERACMCEYEAVLASAAAEGLRSFVGEVAKLLTLLFAGKWVAITSFWGLYPAMSSSNWLSVFSGSALELSVWFE